MWPSQIENDPQSQLPGGHNDPWKFFWRENPGSWSTHEGTINAYTKALLGEIV